MCCSSRQWKHRLQVHFNTHSQFMHYQASYMMFVSLVMLTFLLDVNIYIYIYIFLIIQINFLSQHEDLLVVITTALDKDQALLNAYRDTSSPLFYFDEELEMSISLISMRRPWSLPNVSVMYTQIRKMKVGLIMNVMVTLKSIKVQSIFCVGPGTPVVDV